MTRRWIAFLLLAAAPTALATARGRDGAPRAAIAPASARAGTTSEANANASGGAPAAAVPESNAGATSVDRIAADARAKRAFLDLHFFAGGRGMHQVPELIRAYGLVAPLVNRPLLHDRWGFVIEEGRPVGLLRTRYRDITLGVAGCAMCHTGRAAGRFVPGLGNKNIDVTQTARDVRWLERGFMPLPLHPSQWDDWRALRHQSISFSDRLADPLHGNLTQGLVPLAFIRQWFYRSAGRDLPPDSLHAAVKVPALWGYAAKRPEGSFCDGMGQGVGWAAAVELASGQDYRTVRRYAHRLEETEGLIGAFLPPRYPFSVDAARSRRGASIFADRCAGCHGDYSTDRDGLPIYAAPRFVPLAKVGTDPARLAANTPDFYAVVAANPLGDLMTVHRTERGYFAPRLVGIWSRFPYLHNGSVPSLADLLAPPERRPPAFSLRDAGEESRFDRERVGLTMPREAPAAQTLAERGRRGERSVYFVGRAGHSNRGHPFGTRLDDDAKRDLIEYLKTL